jgi:hypothetical protein
MGTVPSLCYDYSVFETHKSGELMWNLITGKQTVPLCLVCLHSYFRASAFFKKLKIENNCENLQL